MKALKNITTFALAAALLTGIANAQQMSFVDSSLVSGSELEAGASYKFSNVTSGFDAVVTIDGLSNATLLSVDTSSANSIENAAWRPTFVGTGGDGLHYADFSVQFYTSGTTSPSAPASFTSAVYGNDLSDISAGFVMEFAHVEGHTSTLSPDSASWLSAWNFENKTGYSIRMGWQGGNGTDRTIGSYMENTSASSASLVPEPSSILLLTLSLFPLALRRNRP